MYTYMLIEGGVHTTHLNALFQLTGASDFLLLGDVLFVFYISLPGPQNNMQEANEQSTQHNPFFDYSKKKTPPSAFD